MIAQTILTTVGMFTAVGLKTLQGRSIANKNMKIIPIVSYFICLLELTVYGTVLLQGATWTILITSLGAAVGAVTGVWLADILNEKFANKGEDK
jgi:xanthine/uracil permease